MTPAKASTARSRFMTFSSGWRGSWIRRRGWFRLLQALDAEHAEDVFFVDGFGRAVAHLVKEVFLEGDLGQVYPFAGLGPGDIARRNLRQGHEGNTRIAHVGQANRIPGAFEIRRLAGEVSLDIAHDGGPHRFDHEASLRCACGDRRDLDRRNRNAEDRK